MIILDVPTVVTEENIEEIRAAVPREMARLVRPGCMVWQRYPQTSECNTMLRFPAESGMVCRDAGCVSGVWFHDVFYTDDPNGPMIDEDGVDYA